MLTTTSTSDVSQAAQTAYTPKTAGVCTLCNHVLGINYYRINGAVACDGCAFRERQAQPSSHANYVRALLFGIGGSILGLIAYATFTIVTEIEIGFMSLLVGFLVGKAMKMGSKGSGGSRYQITAIALTYAAVSLSAIPVGFAQIAKATAQIAKISQATPRVAPRTIQLSSDASDQHADDQQSDAQPADDPQPAPPTVPATRAPIHRPSLLSAFGTLCLIGLISPIWIFKFNPMDGFIGLIILFVGMRLAWRITAGAEVGSSIEGPFERPGEIAPPPIG